MRGGILIEKRVSAWYQDLKERGVSFGIRFSVHQIFTF